MTDDWGSTRERARKRRRWKWAAAAIVIVTVAPLLTSFVLGIVEGMSTVRDPAHPVELRDHIPYLGVSLAIVGVIAIHVHLWRGSDEVERRAIVDALALAGVAALASLPVLTLAQRPLGLESPAMIGWGWTVAVLAMTRIVQRLRG